MSTFDFDKELAAFDELIGHTPEVVETPAEPTPEVPPAAVEETPTPAPEVPAEPEAEAEAPQQPRDEQGRFTKTEQEEAAEAEAERLLAGKFKSPEELEQAYAELQSLMGQQGSELGDLRSTLERLNTNLERVEEEPEYQQPVIDQSVMEWFEETKETNPEQAFIWAAKNGIEHLREQALEELYEVAPRRAAQYEIAAARHDIVSEFERKLEERIQPYEKSAKRSALEDTFSALRSRYNDVDKYGAAIVEAGKFAPTVASQLQSPDENVRVQALETLYHIARSQSGLQQQQQTPTPPTPAVPSSEDIKLEGSALTQTQTGDAEQVDEAEAWLRQNFDPYVDALHPQDV